ncbi:type VI secretion system-associated FHA domain protein TagH [Arsukibacterium indicum]|uniref:Type VI secretion system-associated FHA domain protein TagH n=1 Tax=Arsukibacterium indicum TaxID=2848612 RepID=A0ABS6MLQ2_9GAMM|nr:type VI secretion system-associated FHA domain protein TagH [Arsukibacterium indicum]MBV2129685.1 type VI secretion system-associated FHA domain protein TagH [Arsukibacterium indicum]
MSQTDMLLELSVLSYHRLSPRQVALKRFDANGGTLGRAEHADWHLPDPERVVSGIHGQISFNDAGFWITDSSTNGLFVNRSVTPLGNGNKVQLADGDLICLGDYEIKVAIINPSAQSAMAFSTSPAAKEAGQGLAVSDFDFDGLSSSAGVASGVAQGAESESLTAATLVSKGENVLANNDMLSESFTPPHSLIPDDWQPQWQQQTLPDEPIKLAAAQQQTVNTGSSDEAMSRSQPDAAQQCLQAFLRALNVPAVPEQYLNNPAWWQQLGEALQASLQGIIEVMRSRSELKSSLRVNQTTFQQRENNPLKFSASVSEAFHNLFNHNASSFMGPRQAVSAAFADISQHEAAIVAGAAGAMQGLLAQLTPAMVEQRDFGGSFIDKVNPAQRYNRYWSLYQALHQELLAEVGRTAKGGVNDDFIRAYEAYLTNQK